MPKRYQRHTEIQIIYHEIRWLVPIVPCNHFCGTNVGNLLHLKQFGRTQARSQKFAMGAVWGVWARSPQRLKILHFFAKIT